MTKTLSKSAFTALRWNYLGFVVRSGSNFVIGIFLARLLGPKPFGQLAAAALVVGIANLLADAGFTTALVQTPDLNEIEIRFVFTVQFLIAALLTLLCMASSGIMATTFHDPAIRNVVLGMAPVFLLQAIGQTASALLRRKMDFKSIQAAQVSSYLAGYLLIGIPLAYLGAGVWSLVAAQLSQSLLFSVQLYWSVRHSILPTLDRSGLRLLRFGSKVTLANIANWGISNLDNAVVGHAFGPTSLGLYSRSFTLASAPCDGIVGTVQQVLFTSCSRAEGRIEPIRRAYLASLSAVATFVFASFWAMAVCAPTVIVGLYGEKWRPAAALFRPLVIAVSINAVMAISGSILASLDQVKREIHAQSLSLVVALICFAVTSHYSPTVLSWGVCGVYIFRFLAATRPTKQLLQLRWRDIVRVLAGPAAAAVVTSIVLYMVEAASLHAGARPIVALLLIIASGCAALPVILYYFGDLVLAPSLVTLLKVGMANMPKPVLKVLERFAERQERRVSSPAGSRASEDMPIPVYIATMSPRNGDTGVHTHFHALSSYLESQKTSVEILTPFEAPTILRKFVGLGARLIKPFSLEYSWFFRDFFYARLLRLRLRTQVPADRPWIVYAQCPMASRAAESFRKRKDQSVVLVTHFNESHAEEMVDGGLIEPHGRFYRYIQANEHKALLGADRIVYVSEFMRDHLVTTVQGLSDRPSVVLPNFVSRPPHGGEEYGGDLASIGTLEPRKNQNFLLEVLAAAKRRGKRYTLTLFGTGKPERQWQQLATDLGIADQVTFAGFVPQASRYLHRFRAYVHAAKIENMPVSLIEALACGLPIIAALVGGVPEIVTQGVTGFFWSLEDPECAAEIVIGLLENKLLLATMSAAAVDTYAERFETQRIAPQLASFILDGSIFATDTKLDVLGGPGFKELVGDQAIL